MEASWRRQPGAWLWISVLMLAATPALAQQPEDPARIVDPRVEQRTCLFEATGEELDMTHGYLEIAGGDHGDVIGIGMPNIFAFFERHTKASSSR